MKIISIEHCHNCNQNMRIELDGGLDGNHVIECPHCGHEHCRVVKNGKVTGDRWDSRNVTFHALTYTIDYNDCTGSSSTNFCGPLWVGTTACS